MKRIIYILTFSVIILTGCRTPQKTVINSKLNQETSICNDNTLTKVQQASEITDEVIRKIINDELDIDIKQVKYDTNKPVDETGKHPVLEESNIQVKKRNEVQEVDSLKRVKDSASAFQAVDKSQLNTVIEKVEETSKKTGVKPIYSVLCVTGLMTLVLFVMWIIFKIRK